MGIPWLSSGEDSVLLLLGSGFNPGGELRFHKPRGKVKKEKNSATPMDCSLPGSCAHGIFPGKNSGVGCHFLLQGNLNPGMEPKPLALFVLADSLSLGHLESP